MCGCTPDGEWASEYNFHPSYGFYGFFGSPSYNITSVLGHGSDHFSFISIFITLGLAAGSGSGSPGCATC